VKDISQTIHLKTAVSPPGERDNVDLRDNVEWIVEENGGMGQPLTGGLLEIRFHPVIRVAHTISGGRRTFDNDREISEGDGGDK